MKLSAESNSLAARPAGMTPEVAEELAALLSVAEDTCKVLNGPPLAVECALAPRDVDHVFVMANLLMELAGYPARAPHLRLIGCKGAEVPPLVLTCSRFRCRTCQCTGAILMDKLPSLGLACASHQLPRCTAATHEAGMLTVQEPGRASAATALCHDPMT